MCIGRRLRQTRGDGRILAYDGGMRRGGIDVAALAAGESGPKVPL